MGLSCVAVNSPGCTAAGSAPFFVSGRSDQQQRRETRPCFFATHHVSSAHIGAASSQPPSIMAFIWGQPSSLLGFAELQDELVGVPANRLVEHIGRAGVRRIGENRTLGIELEARGFDLSAHGRGLDAM
jgi:hypothetical protein